MKNAKQSRCVIGIKGQTPDPDYPVDIWFDSLKSVANVLSKENQQLNYLHWVHDALIIDVFNPDIRYKQGGLVVIDGIDVKKIDLSKEKKPIEY